MPALPTTLLREAPMSKPAPTFPTIAPTALAAVAGGRRSASSRADLDDRLMDRLDSIESAVKDVGKSANPSGGAMSQLMPLVALSMMNQPAQPQAPQVIYVRRRRC